MTISVAVTAVGSIPMIFIGHGNVKWFIFIAASIQGIGNAMMLNTGTALISDVIGQDNTSAAFVYGCYSLADKFANGILLYWLVAAYSSDGHALKYILGIVPTLCAVGCALATWAGLALYADKLAKISSGSLLKKAQADKAKAKKNRTEAERAIANNEVDDAQLLAGEDAEPTQ